VRRAVVRQSVINQFVIPTKQEIKQAEIQINPAAKICGDRRIIALVHNYARAGTYP
jgi:hypothetical protein